jgi:WD40 repeat protein
MKNLLFSSIVLISVVFCLWTDLAFGQLFPEKPTARLSVGRIHDMAYSPDGKLLSVAENIGIWLYDASDLSIVGLLQGHTGDVFSLDFSPDGKMLASGGEDTIIRLWDVQTQKQVGLLQGHTHPVYSLAFSPDGKTLASGELDTTVRLWNVQTQKQAGLLEGHTYPVYSLTFSPDGRLLASASVALFVEALAPQFVQLPLDEPAVRLWDLGTKKQVGKPLQTGMEMECGAIRVFSALVAFSPDGKTLASGSWDGIRLWDVQTQKQVGLLRHPGMVNSVAFGPDGRTLASGSEWGDICFWDVESQKRVGQLWGHIGSVYPLVFSTGWQWLALGGSNGTILLSRVTLETAEVEPKGKQPMTLGGLKRAMLLQNFPNPFNPETWIPFALHESSEVEVRIYDATGHLVRTLQLGQKAPGIYCSKEQAAYWDGKNDAGETVGSGIYFYEMRTRNDTFVRKALLLK